MKNFESKTNNVSAASITHVRNEMYNLYCVLIHKYFYDRTEIVKEDIMNLFDGTYKKVLKELLNHSEDPESLYPDFEIKEEDLFGECLKEKKSLIKRIKKFFKKCA